MQKSHFKLSTTTFARFNSQFRQSVKLVRVFLRVTHALFKKETKVIFVISRFVLI